MLMLAFDVDDFRKIGEKIRVEATRMHVRQMIIYIPHPPLTKEDYFYKASQLKDYLEWLDREFIPLLPDNVFALIGLAHIVEDTSKFKDTIEDKIERIRFDNMTFHLLQELEKIRRKDLLNFFWVHKISIPDDKLDLILNYIEKKTGGKFEEVMQELIRLRQIKYWDYIKDIEINCDPDITDDGHY